jgi:hydrophobic/amphiphilic exporter-1 (mainly G- bacteria), HAE1 family
LLIVEGGQEFALEPQSADRRHNRLFQVVTARPVAVLCVVAAFIVFGSVAFGKLKTTLMPNLEYPQLTIRTNYPAAAPSEVEEKVSRVIEERLGNVPGLVTRSSISRAESSDVLLRFGWGTNMLEATADVRDRLDRIGFDDTEIERPQLLRYDPAQDPMMRLMLFSTGRDVDLMALRAYADDVLKLELSKVEGVAAVRVSGGEEQQIRIELSEAKLNQYRLTARQVVERIRGARVDTSAGVIALDGRDVILRIVSVYESLEVLRAIEVPTGDGGRVTVGELAPQIRRVAKERDTITRLAAEDTGFRAREGVMLEILKEGDANIVETAQQVWVALYGDARWREVRAARGEDIELPELEPEDAGPAAAAPRVRMRRGGIRVGGGRRGGMMPSMGAGTLIDRIPDGFGLRVVSDQSYFIEDAIEDVTAAAVLGALLAVLVLFLFLKSAKATILIAAAIPLSIVTTFIPMQMADVSLNLMSLGGLALGIGMLVDNSVVVIESITRCREEGDDPLSAAVRGISEVGGAILAATMTTIAVFFPIVFVEGVAGQVFRDLSLTVVFSLLASLVVAQFVVPAMLGIGVSGVMGKEKFRYTRGVAGFLKPGENVRGWRYVPWAAQSLIQLPFWLVVLALIAVLDTLAWVARYVWRGAAFAGRMVFKPFSFVFEAVWKAVDGVYPLFLRAALAQPLVVLALVFAAAIAAFSVGGKLETELLPRFQQEEFYVDMAAPDGTQIADTDRGAAALIERAFTEGRFQRDVARVTVESGGEEQAGDSRPVGSHRVRMVVTLKKSADVSTAPEYTQQVLRDLADDTTLFQGTAEVSEPALVQLDTGLVVEVRGHDRQTLAAVAEELAEEMRELRHRDGTPMLRDVRTSIQPGRPQVQIIYDRQALQRVGLTAEAVTAELRNKIGGAVSTQFSSAGDDMEVFVELLRDDKQTLDQVRDIEVSPGVRLREVLYLGGDGLLVTEGPNEIRRVGNQRAVVVMAEPHGIALSGAASAVQELVEAGLVDLTGAEVGFAGQVSEMNESIRSLILALLLALFLVYVVMAVQFESLLDPLVIMFAVPFAGVGVVFALYFFGLPVSVMVLLGGIVLAGIVVNNAIVLVNYANQLVARGQTPMQAAVNASRIRLRPIVITTLTTLLALLPMTGWLDPVMPAAQGIAHVVDLGLYAAVEGLGGSLTAPQGWPGIGGWTFGFERGLDMLTGGGEGAEVRRPLAITVIAGLALSTLLTLIVIPTLWAWVNTLQLRLRQRRAA